MSSSRHESRSATTADCPADSKRSGARRASSTFRTHAAPRQLPTAGARTLPRWVAATAAAGLFAGIAAGLFFDRDRSVGVSEVRGLPRLAGLDLQVRHGEVHGFLGPNGAGKSTTIRVLLGLLRTDGGSATVFGLDPWRDAAAIHRRLAYVPGDVALWPNLSGGETVDLLMRMRDVDPAHERGARSCSSGSSSTRPRRAAPTPRATGRRSRWSPRSPPTPSCWSSTSRPPASTR